MTKRYQLSTKQPFSLEMVNYLIKGVLYNKDIDFKNMISLEITQTGNIYTIECITGTKQ